MSILCWFGIWYLMGLASVLFIATADWWYGLNITIESICFGLVAALLGGTLVVGCVTCERDYRTV